jgi:hypothetical protein
MGTLEDALCIRKLAVIYVDARGVHKTSFTFVLGRPLSPSLKKLMAVSGSPCL